MIRPGGLPRSSAGWRTTPGHWRTRTSCWMCLTPSRANLTVKPAAANTVARKRAVLSNVLGYGVGRGLDANPLAAAAKVWTPPKTTEGMVDPRVVVSRRQAEEL